MADEVIAIMIIISPPISAIHKSLNVDKYIVFSLRIEFTIVLYSIRDFSFNAETLQNVMEFVKEKIYYKYVYHSGGLAQ